jgi:hypothetical protein
VSPWPKRAIAEELARLQGHDPQHEAAGPHVRHYAKWPKPFLWAAFHGALRGQMQLYNVEARP